WSQIGLAMARFSDVWRVTLAYPSAMTSEIASLSQRRRLWIGPFFILMEQKKETLLVSSWRLASAAKGLTRRWSQPLAVVKSTFDFMKQLPVFATHAPDS